MQTKQAIRSGLRRIGIEVRKFPSAAFRPVQVFHLAVHLLMERQGRDIQFVQVGANDGIYGDPLRSYITNHPWRGILVEPQPQIFEKLVENYRQHADRLIFENAAISRDKSDFVLYRAPEGLIRDDVFAASVASGNAKVIAKQLRVSPKQLERIVVPSITLDELLAKHGFGRIQVLQIDVEGFDWQVLRTLDLRRAAPVVIQFEIGHLSNEDCDGAVEHLTRHDYEIYWGGYQGDAVAIKAGSLF